MSEQTKDDITEAMLEVFLKLKDEFTKQKKKFENTNENEEIPNKKVAELDIDEVQETVFRKSDIDEVQETVFRNYTEEEAKEFLGNYFNSLDEPEKEKYIFTNGFISEADNSYYMEYNLKEDPGYSGKTFKMDLASGKGEELEFYTTEEKGSWVRENKLINTFDATQYSNSNENKIDEEKSKQQLNIFNLDEDSLSKNGKEVYKFFKENPELFQKSFNKMMSEIIKHESNKFQESNQKVMGDLNKIRSGIDLSTEKGRELFNKVRDLENTLFNKNLSVHEISKDLKSQNEKSKDKGSENSIGNKEEKTIKEQKTKKQSEREYELEM
ncbi:hypothetical protein KM915_20905 [Cytobacillus oceanisediminis]|uniref:hypothetical protein n=1 Tax=Cytobacillus oceanisediminis TaxID=665099 RepID=UPI001C242C73|nr:hypothetical protein [Cytobacillus oceanisediminis]MBU8732511.1 hypothetical protein [Cytobacillus oceanisediminis]